MSEYRQQLFAFIIEHDIKHAEMLAKVQAQIVQLPHVQRVVGLGTGQHGETVMRSLPGWDLPILPAPSVRD